MPVRVIRLPGDRGAVLRGSPLRALAALACARLLRWHQLSRERRALLALDERMLKDIGVTRAEAEREARRPFWSDGSDPC